MNQEPENNIISENKEANTPMSPFLKVLKSAFDFVELLVFSVISVLLIFSFAFRLCRVDGRSMNNTLYHGEALITENIFYEPERGDIIVFHLCNEYYSEPLVKRVIALEGEKIRIDFKTGTVSVNGQILEEDYAYLDGGGYFMNSEMNPEYTDFKEQVFEATVPVGCIFAMGDNRNHSSDSRSKFVGFVDKNTILGKAVLRVSPFTLFN